MVAELLLTTDMINCFKSCIGQKNYKHFFDKYKRTLCKDLDNFTSVILDDETSMVIAQNIRTFLRFLENFDPKYPGSNVEGASGFRNVSKRIQDEMKDAILGMNWDHFYNEYIPYNIDEIIDEARKQKMIFVKVEHENNWYPNFSSRGIENYSFSKTDTNLERRVPFRTKKSGEMLKFRPVSFRESKTFHYIMNASHSNNEKFGNGKNNFISPTNDIHTANNSTILSSVNMGNRGGNEVETIDARTCQALFNLRSPTPDKQNSIQMVAELLISKDMITCFKSCIGQKNYKPFFDKYKRALCKELDNLPNVILKNETSMIIAQNMRKLIRHLENFNPQYPGNNGQETYGAGSVRENINDDMKDAILGMNWGSFYDKYIPYIDEIIDAAREQNVIFVCIEHESCWYPNFSSKLSSDADTNSETTSDKELDETNSGEMLARPQSLSPDKKEKSSSRAHGIEKEAVKTSSNSNGTSIVNLSKNPQELTIKITRTHRKKTDEELSGLDCTDPDEGVEDVHQKPETMKTEIQADLESYKNHIDSQIEDFETTKNDLKKEMYQKVSKIEAEIKCSLNKITETNQQKIDALQNEIQQKMGDLKLCLEEKIENHVTILKQVVSDSSKELGSKIEEKVEKKFEELQNELRIRKDESDRKLEESLEQLIARTVEKRFEEKFEELRNEKNECERKIRERFEKLISKLLEQKGPSMNSETFEVPDGEETKTETSGGSVDQHGSGSSISVEIMSESNGEEHVDQQINEQEQDPEGAEQDHVSDVSEGSISVENMPGPNQNEHASQEIYEPMASTKSISVFARLLEEMEAAIDNEQVAQEVNDRDVDPHAANQEQPDSSEESEEEDIEQLLAEQNRIHEEELRAVREARIQRNQRAAEERRELAANIAVARNLFR